MCYQVFYHNANITLPPDKITHLSWRHLTKILCPKCSWGIVAGTLFSIPSSWKIDHEQGPVIQKVDNVVHQINLYPVHDVIGFPNTYPLDSAIQRYFKDVFKLPVYTVITGNDFSTELTQNSNIHNDIAPIKTALNYTCWMGYMENKECILWSWRSSSFARSTSSPGVRSRTVGSRESGLHDCRSKMLMKGIQNIGYKSQVTGVISDEMWSYMLFYRLQ